MRESVFETLVGLAVVGIAIAFMFFAVRTGGETTTGGAYEVTARFNSINGIATGTDVRLSGVKVGVVTDINLDPDTYYAELRMTISDTLQVPDDSTAKVTSDGLLGGAYISIDPGGSYDYVPPGGEIEFTRGSIDLLTLVSEFASGGGGE